MFTFQECFKSLNSVLLVHGLSGYIFNEWNRKRLWYIGLVICTGFWFYGCRTFYEFFSFNFLQLQESFDFTRVFNFIDGQLWILATFNTQFIGLRYHHTLKTMIVAIRRPNLRTHHKFLFDLILVTVVAYAYLMIPYFRYIYDSSDGFDWVLVTTTGYQFAVLSIEQIFAVLMIFQVSKNFGSPDLGDLNTAFSGFDANFKVFRKVVKTFEFGIVIHLFNLLLGLTFILFTGFVQQQAAVAIFEYLIWDITFFITLICVNWIHRASKEVIHSLLVCSKRWLV